jgi:hypothetical protein
MSFQQITNIRSTDRVLELSPVEGETALSAAGVPDKRIFTGEQKLHLKMDPQSCLWYFQWEMSGIIPGGLKGKFTGFKAGIKHAEEYFKKRNVRITQVKD